MKKASERTKKYVKQAAIVSAICALIVSAMWLRAGASYVADQFDTAAAMDEVVVEHGTKHGSVNVPSGTHDRDGNFWPGEQAPIEESGVFKLAHARPCRDGQTDVTAYPQFVRSAWERLDSDGVCGTLWESERHNALTHEGAKRMLDCALKASGCPAADSFWFALYEAATETRATQTYADIDELDGAETGYARINITAANWTCTEATPSNCVTASKVFTAGAAWSVTGLALMDADGENSAGNVWAYSNFARTLANTDTLTVTYTLNLQSTAD